MPSVYQLKASFLLVIMLLVMIHNAIPHAHHHDHVEDSNISIEHHHHYTPIGHRHGDGPSNRLEQEGFFDKLFKNHAHNEHVHRYSPITVEHVKLMKHIGRKIYAATTTEYLITEDLINEWAGICFFQDGVPDDPDLFSCPHRGPPAMS